MRITFLRLLAWVASAIGGSTCLFGADSLTYEKDIRPIFREHCFDCHGATDELKGKLDLRLVRLMKAGGESGPAIVAGQPDQSYLVDRVAGGEMPPGEKNISKEDLETIRRWISAGAKTARPEPKELAPGLGVTPEERGFWSFQPIQRPNVRVLSTFAESARVRTAIDALTLEQATRQGIVTRFGAEADRRTLVMRAYLVLTGLPPTPQELQRQLSDTSADWYDELLTRLLASPHYGEHWGRHWLDVAGYADSEGFTVADAPRQWAWKYRDWVIRAINADKPFDEFITEQLAGDELAGPRNGDLTERQIELLTATGFLRMAADGTGSGANTPEGRNQTMTDTLKIVGTSLLGLSIQCAQCHDHRYDPIPQTDYYALRAVFEPALDWNAWKTPQARRVSLYTAADRELAAKAEAKAKVLVAERTKMQSAFIEDALKIELKKYEDPLRGQLDTAFHTAAAKRTDEQKQLLAKHPSVNINGGNLYQYLPKAAEELKKHDKLIADARAMKPREEFVRALIEPANHAPATKLFHRGDHRQPKQTVPPGGLTVTANDGPMPFPVNDTSRPTTGRRLAFANWLTSRENPLFARVIVNRVWMHHFGKGLVATPADFGKLGGRPSHPKLLDWLADEFITQGWSLKQLHRAIMRSSVWRQARDPRAPFRESLLRLEAETIRDRMLAASGTLNRQTFGEPLNIKEDETGQVVVDGDQSRRSMYIQVRRSRPVAMLQAFDAPVMETNCESRAHSTVATQSLMLLNGEFVLKQAAKLADRAAKEAKPFTAERLAKLPEMPKRRSARWQYGYGSYNEKTDRTQSFSPLTQWAESRWQAGSKLPDAKAGWVFLSATGGHPDVPSRAAIRRWTVPDDGEVTITGKLSHGSKNGDGVRSRVVASRSGKHGEWKIQNGAVETNVTAFPVKAGETIDFITDCIANQTSDSFVWPVSVTLKSPGRPDQHLSSTNMFRGPVENVDLLPGQIVRAWQLAYCREPTTEELTLALEFITRQLDTFAEQATALPSNRAATRQALTNLCQSLLSSNEFLYVE